ncbi:heterogeneous nuclear ribonucleoprotein 1-like isoform X2 [Punica granatum]|nr:heterogeneous nuclear ribonucleoprotein 1-like isoform X2 [Punica granatum]
MFGDREEMESDLGKLFIGGISWDTDEERLKEYFGNYGEVVEAVIMKDRVTGRARGFGFVVFADPAVAERVTRDKHMIDGRSVEAKKAVPREDQHLLNRGPSSIPGSPSPGRTKKIFVGGLASNVTESDFKKYFDQFGTITDVVVMYDHNTQRPRGFGFITYDSEDAVDRVLLRTFHDLNGKMVEVKRAVPKELSPGPSRSPIIGYNYNLGSSRVNNFLNSYAPGYNMASIGGYRVRMDGGLNPIATARGGSSPFNGSGHGMGMNLDQGLGPSFTGSANLVNTLGYGRVTSPFYNSNSGRFSNPIGYQGENRRNDSGLSPNFRSLWGNGSIGNSAGPVNLGAYLSTGGGSFGVSFGNTGSNWNPSPIQSSQGGGTGLSYPTGNAGFGSGGGNTFGFGGEGNGRKSSGSFVGSNSSFSGNPGNFEESYSELYREGSGYGGSNWLSSAPEVNTSGSFSYGLGNIGSDVGSRNSGSFVGSYTSTGRESNRG